MHRLVGAIAIFGGWLSFIIGALAGLAASKFLGLNQVEGDQPAVTVYGISGAIVLWIFVAAALLTVVPLARAVFAVNPRRNLGIVAILMAIAGAVLLPDELGRDFGLPLLAGAAALVVGGELVSREAAVAGSAATSQPARGWVFETADEAIDASPGDPPDAAGFAVEPPQAPSEPPLPVPAELGRPSVTAADASVPSAPPPARARGRLSSRPRVGAAASTCPWCSSPVPPAAISCPSCHAALVTSSAGQGSIPGLTEVPADLRRYAEQAARQKKRPSLLSTIFSDDSMPVSGTVPPPSDASALRPPTPELRAEMERLDAEIAAAALPAGEAADPPGEAAPDGGVQSDGDVPGLNAPSGEEGQDPPPT